MTNFKEGNLIKFTNNWIAYTDFDNKNVHVAHLPHYIQAGELGLVATVYSQLNLGTVIDVVVGNTVLVEVPTSVLELV